MSDKSQTKADFVTKLSLPKFIGMVQRLTLDQRELVRSMGFEHLLGLACNFLPRGIIHWLASNFDVHSRSFDLPNGLKFMITPFCIHQVLGISLGGRRIGKKVDASFRVVIAEQTHCKGNYPTIAELDDLIKPGLDGVVFQRVFTMYTLTAFLCPSSHGAVSPDYYHVLEHPENIASFDFSTVVLDKLVDSIESYRGGETTVLGGNMLTLAFLDTDILQVSSKWPRLSLWTSEIVAEYERMDCISTEKLFYGRLPTKHVSQTPFSSSNSHDKFSLSSSYNELKNFLLSVTPEGNQKGFVSTPVEKEVFADIIARVPQTTKQKTIKIVQMGTTWAEHRVFALSMQVYGRVIKYVINIMGKAVIVEQIEKERFGLLPTGYWSKYFMECDIAALFQKSFENPGSLCVHLRSNMIGFMLDSIDMVHMPLFTSGFWYLIVANFRKRLFEVLCPNNKINLIVDEANRTINNFKGAFNIAYKHSNIHVFQMATSFRSVCSSNKEADSGVFTMKLIQSHDGDKTLCFEPEHAKSLRESLTYYMIAHPFNERLPPETKAILRKYGIPYDYTTPGYSPWGQ